MIRLLLEKLRSDCVKIGNCLYHLVIYPFATTKIIEIPANN